MLGMKKFMPLKPMNPKVGILKDKIKKMKPGMPKQKLPEKPQVGGPFVSKPVVPGGNDVKKKLPIVKPVRRYPALDIKKKAL